MDYRQWLGPKIIGGDLDWSQAQTSTFPTFLENYTLHDSYWGGIWMEPPFETVLVFQWDRVWLEWGKNPKMKFPSPSQSGEVSNWPLLLVHLEHLWKLESCYLAPSKFKCAETVANAESKALSERERLNLIEHESKSVRASKDFLNLALDEPLFHTSIEPIYESWIEIWHGGETKFLCLDNCGIPLHIPGL